MRCWTGEARQDRKVATVVAFRMRRRSPGHFSAPTQAEVDQRARSLFELEAAGASSISVFQVVGLLVPKEPFWTGFEGWRRSVRDQATPETQTALPLAKRKRMTDYTLC